MFFLKNVPTHCNVQQECHHAPTIYLEHATRSLVRIQHTGLAGLPITLTQVDHPSNPEQVSLLELLTQRIKKDRDTV